ncbi:MAG: hypothetical protein D6686_15465, partial [Alphaproteobacteria bacterium]
MPDSAIPATGRTVQCGACGHSWLQLPDAAAAAPAKAPAAAPAAPAAPAARPGSEADAQDWEEEFEDPSGQPPAPEDRDLRIIYRKKPDSRLPDREPEE